MDLLLAVSLLASSASQMRIGNVTVGPGETGLAIWLFLMLCRQFARLGPPLTVPLSRLLTFWIVWTLAMCIGTMTGFAVGDFHDPVWFMHDIIAYAVVASTSCMIATEPDAGSRLHRVAWLLSTLGAAWLALQAALGWGLISIASFDPWEWDRLRGLSDNSNQLALFCAVIGLLSFHLAEAAVRLSQKIAALGSMIVAVVVGRLTKSDAFTLVLIAAGPIYLVLKFRTWLALMERKLILRSASAWIVLLGLPLLLAYVAPFGPLMARQVELGMKGMTRGGNTGETVETARLRIHLWNEAIRRGIESGMLGLGPGPHLEIPSSISADRRVTKDEPTHVVHPQVTLAPNFEAHNTLLDVFVQGGLIAVSGLVWLGGTTTLMAYRAKLDAMMTLLCCIAIYSIFHLVIRHPIVWFSIVFCLVTASNACPSSMARVQGSQVDW